MSGWGWAGFAVVDLALLALGWRVRRHLASKTESLAEGEDDD